MKDYNDGKPQRSLSGSDSVCALTVLSPKPHLVLCRVSDVFRIETGGGLWRIDCCASCAYHRKPQTSRSLSPTEQNRLRPRIPTAGFYGLKSCFTFDNSDRPEGIPPYSARYIRYVHLLIYCFDPSLLSTTTVFPTESRINRMCDNLVVLLLYQAPQRQLCPGL